MIHSPSLLYPTHQNVTFNGPPKSLLLTQRKQILSILSAQRLYRKANRRLKMSVLLH